MLNLLNRAIKSGYKSFSRNIGLSAATIFIMLLTIIIITFLFLLNPVSEILILNIKEKIDISVYFEEGVRDEEILEIQNKITESVNTEEIEYISNRDALEKFIEKHKNNPVIMGSLAEIETNPFLASLNIKASDVAEYEKIALFLENAPFNGLINKIDYQERRPVIETVFSFISSVKRVGLIVSVILGIIAILIAFGAIRSAIYNSKEEISIMRLVGASDWFIKAPFLIQGAIIGFISGFLALILTFSFCYFLNNKIEAFASGISMFSIFVSNLGMILLIQFGLGIGLGVISSMIAIRKYLNV